MARRVPITREAAVIGRRILEARRKAGLTGEEVRKLARIHPTCLSFLELGKREPSGPQIRRLAKAFGVTPAELYGPTILHGSCARRRRRVNGSRVTL
jgi:transcriptional regulator with XRE-family HTH domain